MTRRSAARKRLISLFAAAGATDPGRAIAFDVRDDAALARTFMRLHRHGAIVAAAPGRYYLDATRLDRFRGHVRRRAAAIAAGWGVVATTLAAAVAFSLAE